MEKWELGGGKVNTFSEGHVPASGTDFPKGNCKGEVVGKRRVR